MVLQAEERQQLKQKANEIRKEIVKITYTCGGAHIGGSLSQTDIMVALYYKYLKFDPKNPEWEDRDRFLLSKGHGGVGHGAVLADVGFFPRSELDDFNKTGSAVWHAPRPAQGEGCRRLDRFPGPRPGHRQRHGLWRPASSARPGAPTCCSATAS